MRLFIAADFHLLPSYYNYYIAYESALIWLWFGIAWEVV